MATSDHPLAGLLSALRFACQKDFAHLSAVKGLRPLLESALERMPAPARVPFAPVLPEVDGPSPMKRKAALRLLLKEMARAGVDLPAELKVLSVGHPEDALPLFSSAAEPGRVPPTTPPPPRAGPPGAPGALNLRTSSPLSKAPPVAARPNLSRGDAPGAATAATPAAGPAPGAWRTPAAADPLAQKARGKAPAQESLGGTPPKKKRKAAKGQKEANSEARLLSIAPRSGPLSIPLKDVSWRLNPRLLSTLNRKGVRKIGDVLFLLPRCYEDRRKLTPIAELIPGERGVTVGVVRDARDASISGGRRMFRAVLADQTGSISATYFQSGPWLKARFPIGKRLVLSGEVRSSHAGWEMPHPEVEPAEDLESSSIHFNRIVPIYPGFERHEQRAYRELANRVADGFAEKLEEPLPASLLQKLGLMGLPEALKRIHFPRDTDALERLDAHVSDAHRRLAFDELFFLQLGVSLKRQGVKRDTGIQFDISPARLEKALAILPFQLTGAQARVVDEVARDMGRHEPMHRLLQGDVGSGKTAVAMISAALALQDGYQVALMAPTEILAEQHYATFSKLLGPLGYRVGLISAGGKAKAKRDVRDAVGAGEIHLAVGTHALIQGSVQFDRLGLAIIDEQHRFGVLQRHQLMSKGVRPDVLVMTATPIPRTLAMTLYGDLDVSLIDELPPGRTPIVTKVFNEKQRSRVYDQMQSQLAAGHQCYVVYPLVEESETLDLEDATQGAEKIRAAFPGHQVGLLHGRMKQEEKDVVMRDFRERRTQILVSTTVIEVGVDVPNASVMVIEAAERFGLSQLHQLRGRVGRGAAASFCCLVASFARSQESAERLAVMEQSNDGFVIAEKDLELRGPGEFLGTRQSGMPELAVANLARDTDLLVKARAEAQRILAADPRLDSTENQGLVRALEDRWEGRLALAQVG